MNIASLLTLFTPSTGASTNAGITISLTTTTASLAGAVAGGVVLLLACQSFSFEHTIFGAAGAVALAASVWNLVHITHTANENTKALVASTVPAQAA